MKSKKKIVQKSNFKKKNHMCVKKVNYNYSRTYPSIDNKGKDNLIKFELKFLNYYLITIFDSHARIDTILR